MSGNDARRALADMFADRFKTKHYIHIPEASQHDKLSAATRLLSIKQQLIELDTALQTKKEEFKIKMTGVESRRLAFKAKEQQLQSHLAKFDYYIHENDMKSLRATKKAQAERLMCAAKDKELTSTAASAAAFVAKRDKLKEKLDKHLPYARYLEQVMRNCEEFHEIRDVMSRFETLTQTYKELHDKEEGSHTAIEADKQALSKYITSKNAILLSLNNRLSEMQLTYDRLLTKAEQLDSQMTHIEATAASRTLELGKIRMATHAMFHLVLKQSSRMSVHTSGDITDPIEQMDKICTYIMDMTKIIDNIRKTAAVEEHKENAPTFNTAAYCEIEKVDLLAS